MDWTDVEAKLCAQAEQVCQHLLPNGKREGSEWACGDVDGQPGRSLKVNLADKVGVWCDFHGGHDKGKTLVSLWCSVRRQPFKVAIVEMKAFLGLKDDYANRVRPAVSRPASAEVSKETGELWAQSAPPTVGGPVWNYLVERRGIEPLVLEWFAVREIILKGEWVILFPYFGQRKQDLLFEQGRVPSWLKCEALNRHDGKKREWTTPGPEKCLWGMQLSDRMEFADAKHVLICEGEKDAMTWATFGCGHLRGVLPVSVPFGAKWKGQEKGRPGPNREWLDRSWDWLQNFETIFVSMDEDEAGRRAAADIIVEIGPRRCRLVQLPEKTESKEII